jgi:hypothetical protein
LLHTDVAGNLSTMQKHAMPDRVTLDESRVRCT